MLAEGYFFLKMKQALSFFNKEMAKINMRNSFLHVEQQNES